MSYLYMMRNIQRATLQSLTFIYQPERLKLFQVKKQFQVHFILNLKMCQHLLVLFLVCSLNLKRQCLALSCLIMERKKGEDFILEMGGIILQSMRSQTFNLQVMCIQKGVMVCHQEPTTRRDTLITEVFDLIITAQKWVNLKTQVYPKISPQHGHILQITEENQVDFPHQ